MPFVRLSEILPTSVDWLWPHWLAAGCLHVLDGDPGCGKSMLTADLAARISTGRPWPDGAPAAEPASVILLNAEDDAGSTTRSRLTALGANLNLVHAWNPAADDHPPLLPHRIDSLKAAIDRFRPRLVVLDPITAFLDGSVAFNSDPSIRRALRPLAKLAAQRHCAILIVRHLAKTQGQRALYRGLGSIGIVASCRLAWLAAADPNLPNRFVLTAHKTNFTPPENSLTYSLGVPSHRAECAHLAPRDEAIISRGEMSTLPANPLAWLGPAVSSAIELLAPPPAPRERVRRFLADFLKNGPRTSNELRAAAAPLHIKMRTLRRAADDLAIDLRTLGNQHIGQKTYWLLPGQRIPSSALDPGSVDEWIERLDTPVKCVLNHRDTKAQSEERTVENPPARTQT